MKKSIFGCFVFISLITAAQTQSEDPYLYLEEVDGKRALDFVTQQNKLTVDKLSKEPEYASIYAKSLEIFNSTDRIVSPTIYKEYIYNFWQDKDHVRGIWRRTLKESYLNGKPSWEILLDIDELSKKDGIKWVFKGATGLYPNYNQFLINLSNGGGDAVVIKEFDVKTKTFMTDGFVLKEAKTNASYLDENTLIVSTDFGEGTMTTSGYAKQVKLWKRGTPLKDAKLIFNGNTTDVSSSGYVMRDGDKQYLMVNEGLTFYTGKYFVMQNDQLVTLNLPEDIDINNLINNQLILTLKSNLTENGRTYKQGSVISMNFTSLIAGKKEIQLMIEPDEFSSISEISSTKNKLLINILSNVKNELYIFSGESGAWQNKKVNAPDFGTISIGATDEFTDQYFFNFTDFLTPPTLYFADAQTNDFKSIKSLPSYFDSDKYKVEQFRAKSKDGTLVPYFVVSARDLKYDGNNPTLLYAYGGFEASMRPTYSSIIGTAWLEKGGVYVLANIRGGGEYGPKWHQAGLKEKRQNIYNDFHSVAEDLVARKITSSKHLGIKGGSNGGLLMGASFTQRPDLYNAVICAVPLLDMQRFNKLLAGASWMGEYGDPDKPEEWEYIKKYSPYHNLKKDMKYPEVFFTTSTRDDRVHPGHARKMVAKMIDMGYPVYYYENTEGGHAGSSTNEQRAKSAAMEYSYLLMKLKKKN